MTIVHPNDQTLGFASSLLTLWWSDGKTSVRGTRGHWPTLDRVTIRFVLALVLLTPDFGFIEPPGIGPGRPRGRSEL